MKRKDTPKQYVIYSRKSKFTGKGESIENQIELCRQYIAMHFGEDAAENALVYEDEEMCIRDRYKYLQAHPSVPSVHYKRVYNPQPSYGFSHKHKYTLRIG